jgi:uncharacterized protein YndB with AHSA1/START domain
MTEQPEPIVVDCDLDAPPETVWRALTTPELVEAWLGDGDISAEVGHRFAFTPAGEAPVECEVLEAEPGERLRVSWRGRDEAGGAIESEVAFVLLPTIGGGTRLRVVHDGFAQVFATAMIQLPQTLRRRRPHACAWRLAWAA